MVPAEKGIPHASDFYVSKIKATHAANAFTAAGLEQSLLSNFNFSDCSITAVNIGTLEFTTGWKFNNMTYSAVKKVEVNEKKKDEGPNERDKN